MPPELSLDDEPYGTSIQKGRSGIIDIYVSSSYGAAIEKTYSFNITIGATSPSDPSMETDVITGKYYITAPGPPKVDVYRND